MSDSHFVPRTQHAFAFGADLPPVLEVRPPCQVTFETGAAAYERLARGESVEQIGLENFNVVTGPVFVRGADPGDAVRIDVLDVRIASAWSVWLPGFGGLGDRTAELRVREVRIEGADAVISSKLRVPLEAMIGCIGLAPAKGRSSTYMPAYPWGGNMDLREMSPGATLFLPVQVPGALLSVGDLHAAMGAGERTWVSLEAAGEATVRISVEKNKALKYPRLRVGSDTICVGMHENLEAAIKVALDQAYDLLVAECGLEPFDAYAYLCARGGVRLGGPASAIALAVVPDVV